MSCSNPVFIIEKNPIGEAVSVIGNIPTKINKGNFDLYKLVSVANKRLETSNHSETEQMVNILIQLLGKTIIQLHQCMKILSNFQLIYVLLVNNVHNNI